uniref:heat shock protein 105 kDa-like n=1 Tax=Oncorhynchus gorbuscha TaxID=8017 RepID=UPI001EAF3DE6|nr:heat shock protein 105 kDa-like [Oncorhynchus gorbuscha]
MPVEGTDQEAEWRPRMLEELSARTQDESFSPIDEQDMERLSGCVKDTQEWTANRKAAQKRLRPHQDPAVRSDDIRSRQVRGDYLGFMAISL